ncbi:double-strand break repair helicase AddA [Ostreiculturibacter nitratireducens]|uniref:double-strand break repair helicase AddA n=1 Tax=Ostreiculturibacter nitratireducens TaxID=3075226 RepID=UPI0031B5A218
MRRDEASERQVQAADPGTSTWLSANAGSGKTRVLTDRVARLLLEGTEPQHILCLTYTKAAAAEMQNRLFARLGAWAMLPEEKLRDELRKLGEDGTIGTEMLAKARRLFARAIDAPGGLKIQTIHSFCAALLRRFPLEAGVSPDFTEMDDRAANLMRAEIVEELADGADIAAVDAVASLMSGEDFAPLLGDLCRNIEEFSHPLNAEAAWSLFGLPTGFDAGALLGEVFLGGEAELIAKLLPLLLGSSTNDVKAGNKLAAADFSAPGPATLAILENVLLTGEGAKVPFSAKIGSFPTKGLSNGPAAPLIPALEALMLRVEAARERRIALAAAEKTLALHRFAAAFLPRYTARKALRGWLDFDDLITRAAALLSDRSVAQWVLYRLDGGIDHILVDEAQDTSPGQWTVIERIAEEFTSGEGARDRARTIFVVGDKKQSIYSFQGADLREFERMREHFMAKFAAVRRPMQSLELQHSFRSSEAILRLVDLTMDARVNHGLGGQTTHIAFHEAKPGRVDLWPPVEKVEEPEPENWYDPTDLLGEEHHTLRLARRIAREVKRMIDVGTRIKTSTGPRAIHEGDVLILVQRRSPLFAEVIRACKAEGLEVAGADRLKLGAELAVKDLGALLSFLATPEDDLSLAAALRSPLFGWSEADLYALAQPRAHKEYLWAALRQKKEEHPETLEILSDLLGRADYLRPYELIERVLTRHDGRRRLLARLGPEAEDGIDELLSQALAFEQSEVPSLTGFLVWLQTDDVEVKRRLEGGGRSIRVMTVHGAKGLEAPIVILPDTAKSNPPMRDEVFRVGQGHAVWKTGKTESPAIIAAERAEMEERRREERMRLLYVAMTRAESWLIVCAAGDVGNGEDSWYSLIRDGMEKAGAETNLTAVEAELGFGPVQRMQYGDWPEPRRDEKGAETRLPALPGWALSRAPALPEPDKALSPSDLGGAKALPGEAAERDEEAAKRHGRQLHLLLEHLPLWPEAEWADVARTLLETGEDSALPSEIEPLFEEARRVLTAPAMRAYLGPSALVEAEITARLPELGGRLIHGAIDRLVVEADRVLAIDYKSNAVVPPSAREVPEGILRQMGAYAAALSRIYPGREIATAILWTRTGELMALDPEVVREALTSTPIP